MTLNDIKNKYKDVATLSILDTNNSIEVASIVVNPDKRNEGLGTQIMNDVIAYADSVGKPVSLTPSKEFGGKITKLNDFYRNLGFKPNKGRNKDYQISNTLIRPVTESNNAIQLKTFIESFKRDDTRLIHAIMEGYTVIFESSIDVITLYHGTKPNRVQSIEQNGITNSMYDSPTWYTLASDIESAIFHSDSDGDKSTIFKMEIPIGERKHWPGYPYLWKAEEFSNGRKWYAIKQPIPVEFIVDKIEIPHQQYQEQKRIGF